MMKSKKNIKNMEMRIYELLGIKIFRKMAFGFCYILLFPKTLKMSKEERKEFYKEFHNFRSNYHLGKVKSLEDVRNFKNICIVMRLFIYLDYYCAFLVF